MIGFLLGRCSGIYTPLFTVGPKTEGVPVGLVGGAVVVVVVGGGVVVVVGACAKPHTIEPVTPIRRSAFFIFLGIR